MKRLLGRLGVDGAMALAFVVAAIAAFLHTYSFPDSAASWPRWVIGSFGALSLVLVVVKLAVGRGDAS